MRVIVSQFIANDTNGDPVVYEEIFGLSTDTKPTAGLAMGSKFTEVDTGDTYLFNEDETTAANAWVKQGASAASEGD
jgi:hypothetical protein